VDKLPAVRVLGSDCTGQVPRSQPRGGHVEEPPLLRFGTGNWPQAQRPALANSQPVDNSGERDGGARALWGHFHFLPASVRRRGAGTGAHGQGGSPTPNPVTAGPSWRTWPVGWCPSGQGRGSRARAMAARGGCPDTPAEATGVAQDPRRDWSACGPTRCCREAPVR